MWGHHGMVHSMGCRRQLTNSMCAEIACRESREGRVVAATALVRFFAPELRSVLSVVYHSLPLPQIRCT